MAQSKSAKNNRKRRWVVVSYDASVGLGVVVATYKSRKAADLSPEARGLFRAVQRETPEERHLRMVFTA